MTDEQDNGATVREWTDYVRRLRLGRQVKGILMVFATYADGDGTRVFPGAARLAVDCEVSYNYASDVITFAREVGLIELVRRGNKRTRRADEYRLIFGAQILDHVAILDPITQRAAIDLARAAHGKVASEGPRRLIIPSRAARDLLSPAGDKDAGSVLPPTGEQNGKVLPPTGQIEPSEPSISPAPVGTETAISPVPVVGLVLSGTGPTIPLDQSQLRTEPTRVDLDTAVTHSRASPIQDPDLPPLPKSCPHGLASRLRPGGTLSCPMCRRAAEAALNHPSLALRLVTPRETA